MKTFRIIFTAIVLAACALPAVLLLLGFKNANAENRPLAKMPAVVENGGPNLEFARGFDKYFDDNFALREYLVAGCSAVSVSLLGDYNGQNAVIGKEGRIYYADTLDDYQGLGTLSASDIASAADYLAALQKQYEDMGVRLVFLIAPNKATIYPEYMPDQLAVTDSERNIDLLQAALDERGVNYIDAKALLTAQKPNYDLYYLRDSHWNNTGAVLVYNAAAQMLGLDTYDPSDFTTVCDYKGDLVNFVYPSQKHYEDRAVYLMPREYRPEEHSVNFDMFDINRTSSEANDICLLIYHDSFGKSLQPIFSPSVGSLVMIKSNSPKYRAEDAVTYGADAVIVELVERNLDLLCEYAVKNGF